MRTKRIKIRIPSLKESVSGIWNIPSKVNQVLLLAHGAGAGMEHSFMEELAISLTEKGIGVLRFNLLYMEKGGKPPDRKPKVLPVIEAAIKKASLSYPDLPLFYGGKSFGGRMGSHYLAETKTNDLKGILYFGFPLHAPGKPSTHRADHLASIKIPQLFLQGTRDTLATLELIKEVVKPIRKGSLQILEGADHSFKVLKRSGKTNEEVIADLAKKAHLWIQKKS